MAILINAIEALCRIFAEAVMSRLSARLADTLISLYNPNTSYRLTSTLEIAKIMERLANPLYIRALRYTRVDC